MTRPTFIAHRVTVILMAVGVLVATGDGFAQSYAGLYRWAIEHGLSEWKAESFPLLVDLFVLVGELGLFALALEGHRLQRGMAWADLALPFGIATAGWGVSLVFNVGAVDHEFADQATAAVPPVASMLGLLVLLRTLHRLVSRAAEADGEPVRVQAEPVPADAPGRLSGVASLPAAAPSEGAAEVPPVPAGEVRPGTPVPDIEVHAPEREVPVPEGAPGPDRLQAKAVEVFAAEIEQGRVPGVRKIKARLNVGQPRAKEVQGYLAVLVEASPR